MKFRKVKNEKRWLSQDKQSFIKADIFMKEKGKEYYLYNSEFKKFWWFGSAEEAIEFTNQNNWQYK